MTEICCLKDRITSEVTSRDSGKMINLVLSTSFKMQKKKREKIALELIIAER